MDTFLSNPTTHCHPSNSDLIAAVQLKNNIKAQATTTEEQPSSILLSALRTYSASAVAVSQNRRSSADNWTTTRQRQNRCQWPNFRTLEKD